MIFENSNFDLWSKSADFVVGRSVRLQSLPKKIFIANGQKFMKKFEKSYPPKKRAFFFGGGVVFFNFFHEFLSVCDKKNFGKTLELTRPFGYKIGRLSVGFGHKSNFKFSKITIFSFLKQNFGTFFFQN